MFLRLYESDEKDDRLQLPATVIEGYPPFPGETPVAFQERWAAFELSAIIPPVPDYVGEVGDESSSFRVLITGNSLLVFGRDYATVRREFFKHLEVIKNWHLRKNAAASD